MNARRYGLIDAAATAQFSEELEDFQDLANDLRDFLRDVGLVFPIPQFSDATEALTLLRNCVTILENAVIMRRGLAVAASNCQASSRLAAEGLSTPLVGDEGLGPTGRVRRELPHIPSITLPERFTVRSAPRLTGHLETLLDIAQEFDWPDERFPALAAETQRLVERGQDWLDAAQDTLDGEEGKESPGQARLEALEMHVELLQQYVESLGDQDLEGALESLNELA